MVALHDEQVFAGVRIPDPRGAVQPPGGDGRAVGAVGDARNPRAGGFQNLNRQAGGRIPQAHEAIAAPGGDPRPIRAEGDAENRDDLLLVRLARHDHEAPAPGVHIPDAQGAIAPAGGQPRSIRAERDRAHLAVKAFEDVMQRPGRCLRLRRCPDAHRAESGPGGEQAPGGVERKAAQRLGMLDGKAGRCVPVGGGIEPDAARSRHGESRAVRRPCRDR